MSNLSKSCKFVPINYYFYFWSQTMPLLCGIVAKNTVGVNVLYCDTGSSFISTAPIDEPVKQSWMDRRTVASAPPNLPRHEDAQLWMCANISSSSSNQAGTADQTVPTAGYVLLVDGKGSLNYPLTKQEALADKINSEDEVLDRRNFNSLEHYLEF